MGTWNGQKLAGAAGVVFVVATVVAIFMVSPPPSPDESPAKFLEYYSDHRSAIIAQALVGLLANIPAILFIAGLWNVLRRDEADGGVLSTSSVIAFIFGGVIVTIGTAWVGALGYLGDGNGLDEASARNLSLLGAMTGLPASFAAFAGYSAASGYLLLRGATLPRWLGWIGMVAALLTVLATFGVAKSGFFAPFGVASFLGFVSILVYVLLVSFFMWRRAE